MTRESLVIQLVTARCQHGPSNGRTRHPYAFSPTFLGDASQRPLPSEDNSMAWYRVRSLPLNFLLDPQHAQQHNLTYSFHLLLYLLPDFVYLPPHPQVTQFFSFFPPSFCHTALFPRTLNTHTHAHSLTHSLIQSLL